MQIPSKSDVDPMQIKRPFNANQVSTYANLCQSDVKSMPIAIALARIGTDHANRLLIGGHLYM